MGTPLKATGIKATATKKPRISVNKLGEYMEATSARRKRIVHEAKHPSTFITARYKDAREFIKEYYLSGFDESILQGALRDFSKRKPATEWQESDLSGSIDAVEAILDCEPPDFDGLTISGLSDNTLVDIKGVDVSVNPDIILKGIIKGVPTIGAIKFHLVKANPINEEAGKTIATMLAQYIENHKKGKKDIISLDYCLSIDVFSNKVVSAPTSFKRRMAHIETSCEEISLWWGML